MNRMGTEDEEVKWIGNEERAFVCSMHTIGSSHSNHNARNSNGDTRKSTDVRVPTYIKVSEVQAKLLYSGCCYFHFYCPCFSSYIGRADTHSIL